MKRQASGSPPQLVEYWLADGKPAGPGISFSFDVAIPPPARRMCKPLRMSVVIRRRRLQSSSWRMS